MKVIEITKAGPGKPIAWIEAGIHAREWIARYYPTKTIFANMIFAKGPSINDVGPFSRIYDPLPPLVGSGY